MKTVFVWVVILVPAVILAVYIGQSVSSDVAALATGMIIGLMGAALAALITFLVRDERHMRQRSEAGRGWRVSVAPEQSQVVDGEWREVGPSTNAAHTNPGQGAGRTGARIEAPERALVVRR